MRDKSGESLGTPWAVWLGVATVPEALTAGLVGAGVPLALADVRLKPGYYSAFDRLQRSIGFVLGPWVVAAAVTGLIWIGGNLLKFRVPVLEVFFTLICGASAVSILEALR